MNIIEKYINMQIQIEMQTSLLEVSGLEYPKTTSSKAVKTK